MFILLCDRGAITSSLRSFEPSVCHSRDGKISPSVVPNGTTNELAGLFFKLSPLMLSVMQGSYKFQLLSPWFNPTRNRTISLPFQKQTLYPLGHLSGRLIIFFGLGLLVVLPFSEQLIIGKSAVDTLTIENAILLLE